MSYVPRRGSATEKALAYLREEGMTCSQELAEFIGQPRTSSRVVGDAPLFAEVA